MEALAVLVVFPVLIGIASQLALRDARRAAFTATLVATLLVAGCLVAGDPRSGWTWLATLLVLPLPIAFALAAVLICYGRSQVRHKHHR